MGADATQLERGREDTRRADAIGTSARGQPVRSPITALQRCTQLVYSTDDEPHPAPVSTVQAEYAAWESVQKESCTAATMRHHGVLNARHAAFQRVCTQ